MSGRGLGAKAEARSETTRDPMKQNVNVWYCLSGEQAKQPFCSFVSSSLRRGSLFSPMPGRKAELRSDEEGALSVPSPH